MSDDTLDAALAALRSWRQRSAAVAAERDPLIRAAIGAGVNDHAIHTASGVSRTTIGQVRDPGGPLAVREAARRATRSTDSVVISTHGHQVRLWLAVDDSRLSVADDDPNPDAARDAAHGEWLRRMNNAGAVLTSLRRAGLQATCSGEPEGSDEQEHLASLDEQYVIITR